MFNENFSHATKKFTFEAKDFPFTTLDEVIKENGNVTLTVRSMFITKKSKHGPRPAIITDSLIVYLPDHCLEDVKKIMASDEYIEAVNAGKCGFTTRQYNDKYGNVRNTGNFCDI